MEGKNYGKLVKALQIVAGIFMVAMVVVCIILMQKYEIKVTKIPQLAEQIQGGTMVIASGIILFSVVKSFALIFPPAVVFAICGYLMPNYWIGLLINVVSVFLSAFIPYFLGRFTGAGIIDTLKGRFNAVKKLDDFKGANETQMTFAIKLSGIIPGDLSSLLFGAIGVSFKKYMIGTNFGMLPLAIVYTAFGITLKNVGEKPWVAVILVAVIIMFVIVASVMTKRFIEKTKKEQGVENG